MGLGVTVVEDLRRRFFFFLPGLPLITFTELTEASSLTAIIKAESFETRRGLSREVKEVGESARKFADFSSLGNSFLEIGMMSIGLCSGG